MVQLFCLRDQLSDLRGSLRLEGVSRRKQKFAGEKRFQIPVLADVILGEAEQFQTENQRVVMRNLTVAEQGVGGSRIDEINLTGSQKLRAVFRAECDASLCHI